MLYEDFKTVWHDRRFAIWVYAILGFGITVMLALGIIVEIPMWIFMMEVFIFWLNLFFAAVNFRWFKKRWVVYTIDGETYVDEENQEIYNFIELEEYQLCQVQSTGQDESDVMTS